VLSASLQSRESELSELRDGFDGEHEALKDYHLRACSDILGHACYAHL
jgi:hypothetical protein